MSNPHDEEYARLMRRILACGVDKGDRTGTGTRSLFGHMMQFDLTEGFPLLTLKRTPFYTIVKELLWFIQGGRGSGRMNNNDLVEDGVDIWTPWAKVGGDLGPIYGAQWRSWPKPDGSYIDQLATVEGKLKESPDDRRLIVSAWNVGVLDQMALPPCHLLFQFYSYASGSERYLDLMMYQRSCDMFIGVPFNIASYALLLHLMASATGHQPGMFKWVGGDCHIYSNHLDHAKQMLHREPYDAPTLLLHRHGLWLDDYQLSDIELVDYKSHRKISAEVAV